jgi:hypothetical protein
MIEDVLTSIRSAQEGDVDLIAKLAAADDHAALIPTHVVERSGQVIGCVHLGILPTVSLWLDSKRAKRSDSVAVMNFIHNAVRDRGGLQVAQPCEDSSPFRSLVERAGYKEIRLFVKTL